MAYTTNPSLPRVRMEAVKLLRQGYSTRQVARHFGYSQSVIVKWNKRAPDDGRLTIPTISSRPNSHPNKLDWRIRKKIINFRIKTNGRCSEVIHKLLINENIEVSLSTVKRVLDSNNMLRKKSPWKKMHKYIERPKALNPGDLVQMDTIHIMKNKTQRLYIYTLLDVYSRWAYALASNKISSGITLNVVSKAKRKSSFNFNCLQTDHGPEFSRYFTNNSNIKHRHSRIRKPNDNAHVERFNRTIQDEFLRYIPRDVDEINRQLPKYLKYYNQERLHLGINLQTPSQLLSK